MIEVEQIEPGIIRYIWSGFVDMKDAEFALEKIVALNGKAPYIAIVDVRELKRIPSNIAHVQANIKAEMRHGLQGYVILGASGFFESLVRTITVLAPTTYKFAQDETKAVESAREMLAAGVNSREV